MIRRALILFGLGCMATSMRAQDILGIAQAISVLEGFGDPQSLCARLNNPGCLSYAKQPGARPGALGYAEFAKASDGWEALLNDLRAKCRRGMTVSDIIDAWTVHPEARKRYRREFKRRGLL